MSFQGVLASGRSFLNKYPRDSKWWQLASVTTMTLVACISRAYACGWHRATVQNDHILYEALKQSKLEGRGLVTVMNHVSVLDDPLVWAMMPFKSFRTPGYTRWTLGADNICFRNKFESTFFSLGQTLSTKRFGAGPFQPALDAAITLLSRPVDDGYYLRSHVPPPRQNYGQMNGNPADQGAAQPTNKLSSQPQWVHIYPEGFVHQPFAPHEFTMKYFKWGVSRLILEPARPPIVVPIFGHGLQSVFPEDNPRILGHGFKRPLLYEAGPPLDELRIAEFRNRWADLAAPFATTGYVPSELQTGEASCQLRSEVASFVREGVSQIRDLYNLGAENPNFSRADFWKNQTEVRIKGKD